MGQMADSLPDQDYKDDACLQGKGGAAPGQKHWIPQRWCKATVGTASTLVHLPVSLEGLEDPERAQR